MDTISAIRHSVTHNGVRDAEPMRTFGEYLTDYAYRSVTIYRLNGNKILLNPVAENVTLSFCQIRPVVKISVGHAPHLVIPNLTINDRFRQS